MQHVYETSVRYKTMYIVSALFLLSLGVLSLFEHRVNAVYTILVFLGCIIFAANPDYAAEFKMEFEKKQNQLVTPFSDLMLPEKKTEKYFAQWGL